MPDAFIKPANKIQKHQGYTRTHAGKIGQASWLIKIRFK